MVFKLLEAAQKSWRRLVPNPVVTGLSPVTPDRYSKDWSRAWIGRRRPGNTVGNSEHHPYWPATDTPFRNKRTSDPRCLTDPRGHRARPAAPARSAAGWIRHEPSRSRGSSEVIVAKRPSSARRLSSGGPDGDHRKTNRRMLSPTSEQLHRREPPGRAEA